MQIKTALILCAGFGKRLNPLTLDIPKPLIQLKDKTMLENCINLIIKLGIKKIIRITGQRIPSSAGFSSGFMYAIWK